MSTRTDALARLDAAWPDADDEIRLTDEQAHAVDLFRGGEDVAIEAGAGAGKTSTLIAMAEATDGIGHYLAFNTKIVDEAKRKMPQTVTASTAHSLAMRAIGFQFRHRIGAGRMPSWKIANLLGVDRYKVTWDRGAKVLSADYLASTVMRALRNFAFSADNEPGAQHVPYIEGIDMPDTEGRRTYANNAHVRDYLAQFLSEAWNDVTSPDGVLPYSHDFYLKLWQLSSPRIPVEFVLFDEAQDAAPVMLAIVAAQEHAQKVFVGDTQQQIYEWRGAVNALASIDAKQRAFLTQSFRFGPAIADVANLILDELEADLRLVGAAAHESTVERVEKPDAVLTRSNAAAVTEVLIEQAAGGRPYLVGGGQEVVSFARGAGDLQERGRTGHPELACFTSWTEVQEYVARDPQGDELRLLVKLVDEFGVPVILKALDGMTPDKERHATVVVSTAHKAKGCEWDSVRLAGDFPPEIADLGEWRLVYVAATRARRVLDLDLCGPLVDLRREAAQTLPAVS